MESRPPDEGRTVALEDLDAALRERDLALLEERFAPGLTDDVPRPLEARYYLYRGLAARRKGESVRAAELLIQARRLAEDCADEALLGRVMLESGLLERDALRYDRALELLESAGERLSAVGDLTGVLEANVALSTALRHLGRYEEAERLLRWNLERAGDLGLERSQAVAWANLGVLFKRTGRTIEARLAQRRAVECFEALGDEKREAVSRLNLGNIYKSMGEHAAALSCYQRCLMLTTHTGQRREHGGALTNLGLLYTRQGRFADAEDAFDQALQVFDEIGEERWAANAHHGRGMVALHRGRFPAARELLERAVEMYGRLEYRSGLAGSLMGLAAVAFRVGEEKRGRRLADEAVAAKEDLGELRLAHLYLLEYGLYLTISGRLAAAGKLFARAESHARTIGEPMEPQYQAAVLSWWRLNNDERDGALSAGARAVKLSERFAEPPVAALASLAYGRALLAAGWIEQADEQLNESRKAFEALEMPYEAALAWRASVDFYRKVDNAAFADLAAERYRSLAEGCGAVQLRRLRTG
jgi:tetratricopeptide (TPR) repeat protein